jgi:hypothetical protein
MPIPIIVERDTEGLKEAIVALFEEDFQLRCINEAKLTADAETRGRALDDMEERKLSPGYYARASYLLDLANSIEAGIQYAAADLPRDDVRGLQVVRQARNIFESNHPACSNCGERQDSRYAPQCRGCHVEFARRDG